ncbi:hypothetical protein GCM10027217_19030 [Pseudomaricurvus hydrocarbonicus]
MAKLFITLGNLSGIVGVLLCGISGLMRMLGYFHMMSYDTMTIFTVGMALMIFCLLIKQEFVMWKVHEQ